ncbi:hypothetical protein ACP70R_023616 [Stipagrostis hirtigluma subsp. patula]
MFPALLAQCPLGTSAAKRAGARPRRKSPPTPTPPPPPPHGGCAATRAHGCRSCSCWGSSPSSGASRRAAATSSSRARPKCGTTWLKALAFATMARGAHPPARAEHPLLRLNPHDCVPFMYNLFAAGSGSALDALPSPRLMSTHMHHSLLPASITENPGCKIIYICRDPKDMLVSLWHFVRELIPDLTFSDLFEHACQGVSYNGPIWDHVLGYWNASKASPEKVLFLRYEDMLRNPIDNTRNLARFVGQPFSPAEEEEGVAMDIVRLCNFEKLKNLEVNRNAGSSRLLMANDKYFRKGKVGDWVNHMTPDMARRLDTIVEEKLRGSGLSFA